MAQAILRPTVVDFIEIATGHEHLELQMEEILIPDHSVFIGESLASSGFRKETGVIIVGIKKECGKMGFNPESHTKLEARDILIVLGEPTAILKLDKLVSCGSSAEELLKKHRKN
jgi:voltage-gated potassium channel